MLIDVNYTPNLVVRSPLSFGLPFILSLRLRGTPHKLGWSSPIGIDLHSHRSPVESSIVR